MENKTVALIAEIMQREEVTQEEHLILQQLSDIVSGKKDEFFTTEMIEVFYNYTDILNCLPEEASEILKPFYTTPNLRNHQNKKTDTSDSL